MSTVVKRYLLDKSLDRHVTTMTLDDAVHYSDEDRARITAQYPEHERDTRTRGIPQMGSGRVFLVDEQKLLVDPFECPRHWVRFGGLDPGWTHFAAFCECWGGVPIMVDGKIIGAIGVSGMLPTQDGQVANAGASGLK